VEIGTRGRLDHHRDSAATKRHKLWLLFYTNLGSGSRCGQNYKPVGRVMAVSEKLWINRLQTMTSGAELFSKRSSCPEDSVRIWLVRRHLVLPRSRGHVGRL